MISKTATVIYYDTSVNVNKDNLSVIVLMRLVNETRRINTICNKGLFYFEYKLFPFVTSTVAIESKRMDNSKAAWDSDVSICLWCKSGSCKENEWMV